MVDFPLVVEAIFRYICANMKPERQAWGSSRVYYSIQGLRQEHGVDFLVTLMRHSRTHERKHLVVAPTRYMKLLEMVELITK